MKPVSPALATILLALAASVGCQIGGTPPTPSAAPTGGTTAPRATPRVRPTATKVPCTREAPVAAPTKGTPRQGAYDQLKLPYGWDTDMADEAAVTEAIAAEEAGPNWPCFTRFYPEAVAVYERSK
jgi:hypothetical protein